jgi:hypothetical protein
MLESTDTEYAPCGYIVRSDDKRRARLNLIAHFLSLIPTDCREKVELPNRSKKTPRRHHLDREPTFHEAGKVLSSDCAQNAELV